MARVARARKKPKKNEVKEIEEVNEVKEVKEVKERRDVVEVVADSDCGVTDGTRFRSIVAKTMAMVSMAAKGMSVAAAWEKPTIPAVVGRRSRSQRAASEP